MPSIEAPIWTSSCNIEINVLPLNAPFQFISMGVELWANHMGLLVMPIVVEKYG
jgi:hypothetical protein